MSSRTFRCAECGQGTVRPVARPGRTMQYRTMTLDIPGDLPISTCDRCGEEWLDETTAGLLDQALEVQYRKRLGALAQQSLAALTAHITLKELEQLLGLSQGYLSKIRGGQRDASPDLASHLALLAADPQPRLDELRALWKNAAA